MTLVRLRCEHCRSVLAQIDRAPGDWSGNYVFPRCRKCDIPSPDRMVGVLLASGRDSFSLAGEIPWADLKPLIDRARSRGKPSDLIVRVRDSDVT